LKFSSANQNISIAAASIGLIDAVYLAVEKLSHNQAMCLPGLGDCWTVSNSQYSLVYGIPVSVFGAAAYLMLLVLLLTDGRSLINKELSDQLVFGISLAGFVFSIYLTYLEIAVIKAVCPFCVISAIMMTVLLICTFMRLVPNQHDFKMSSEDKNG
jgi:uncharacterized membrane protein